MDWLNYHHLFYFWTVAKAGSISRASRELRLTQPTISAQIQRLEEAIGAPLFTREGRGLKLTEEGRVAQRYAEEIFSLGREMIGVVRGQPPDKPLKFVVGVADVFPKLVTHRLLASLAALKKPITLVCREGRTERLLAELALHGVDMVLADGPLPPSPSVRAYSHLLGECGAVLCATPDLAKRYSTKRGSLRALDGAPFLLPTEGSVLRASLDEWLRDREVRPQVVGEFDDSSLLKVFGGAGAGLFAVPEVVEREVVAHYGVSVVARMPEIRERFYAISIERRIKHPAVAMISAAARTSIFG